MKKIKNFKINIRPREVMRLLKNTTRLGEITPQIEEMVQRETRRLQKVVAPAAIYETQPKEKFPQALAADPPENWVAASVYLFTIGHDIEREISEARKRDENVLSDILHSIAIEALEQSGNFINRLLLDEAKEESCELSCRQSVGNGDPWQSFLRILPGDKIGVERRDEEAFSPRYTSGTVVFWSPVKKRGSKPS